MDLNELLYAHQLEVMKASTCGDEAHFEKISEYAARIRQLRTMAPVNAIPTEDTAPPTIIYGSYAGTALAQIRDDQVEKQNETNAAQPELPLSE